MSSRVLRKLQGEKENELQGEVSDTDVDVGGARRKQLNINRYDLLNQQSHSESEVKEDDNETEAAKSCDGDVHEVKKRKKKKKKKSGKNVNPQRSSEDNADVDEIERSVREVNRLLGDNVVHRVAVSSCSKSEKSPNARKSILNVQHKHLVPSNELKRIFGSKIIPTEHKRRNRGTGRSHVKSTWLVNSKENWPQVGKTGISMSLVETKPGGIQMFVFEHSQTYIQTQNKFLDAVESINPDNIVAIINEHPYHVDALIQLSELCKMSEDLAIAAELIERALYCLECSFHPLFSITQGNCRLDYKRQENRAFFVTLFKHLTFVGGRACYRTALEFCKLLLTLNDTDPLAIKLALDFYALRAKEYSWFIEFVEEFDVSKNLLQLPNFAYSIAVAHFYAFPEDTTKADSLLQNALLMFPSALLPLLEKCSVQTDNRVTKHDYFNPDKTYPTGLTQLISLYVNRSYHIWKENDLISWLERNVHTVLDRVDQKDPLVDWCKATINKRFQGPVPLSIARHLILSDIKGVSVLTQQDFSEPVMSFDPLPPPDSINLYSRRTTRALSTVGPIGIFFRSLLPNFNAQNFPNIVDEHEEGARAAEAAVNNEGNGDEAGVVAYGAEIRSNVISLVNAMRELLNNIRVPDVPDDADVDENDDSDEEEDQNYLT